jgi:hypothetical protein
MKLRKTQLALCIALVMLLAVAAVSGCKNKAETTGAEKSFIFSVTFADGQTEEQSIVTTEETVGAALLKEGLISGEESDFGLYIKSVAGVSADYESDGAYWAFYVDGEFAVSGADTTAIQDGATYSFVYTKG